MIFEDNLVAIVGLICFVVGYLVADYRVKRLFNEKEPSANLIVTEMEGEDPYVFMEFLDDIPSKKTGENVIVRVTKLKK